MKCSSYKKVMSFNSKSSIKSKRRFARVTKIRKSVFEFKNEKRRSCECKMDSSESEAEDVKHEWTIAVLKNNLRQQLLLPMRRMRQTDSWLLSLENGKVEDIQYSVGSTEANHAFLWATFLGRLDLMKYFEEKGADVNFVNESENFNALHLAALNGSVECCEWLLEKRCLVIQTFDGLTPIHYAVFGNSKNVVEYLINNDCKVPHTVINSAVYANAIECVKFLLSLGVDVNVYQYGMTALHVATDLRYLECMKELLNEPSINVNLKTEARGYTALHLAAENGYADCIELLLSKQGRVSEVNSKQQTPLHLACTMNYLDCVETLLKNNAPINEIDQDHKTPLYASIASKSQQSFAVVEMLVKWKANVNVPDRYGYTPLHLAALNELEECATFLILNGANVAAATKTGLTALNVICRKTPDSVPAIWKSFTKSLAYNSERNLKFSFRELVINSKVGEVGYLYTLQKEGHKEMLQHPLCKAFLHMKWEKIKIYYFIRVFLILFTACLLSFIIMADVIHNKCYGDDGKEIDMPEAEENACLKELMDSLDEPVRNLVLEIAWYILKSMAVLILIRNLLCKVAYSSFKDYFSNTLNLAELTVILLIFSICIKIIHGELCLWQKVAATAVVLLSWAYLTLIIGQLPFFGTYISMFKKVLKELLKLLTVYFCLLMGFTFTFGVLFPRSETFGNPITGFVRTLAMMTGELNLTDITSKVESYHKLAIFIVLTLFIILVTMALMNLLVGIAVNDVEGLQKTAGISKLVHQTQLIYFLELAFFHGYIPKRLTKVFKQFFFLSPNLYDRLVIYVRPLNPLEKRIPKDIIMEALQMALDKNKPVSEENNDISEKIDALEIKISEMYNSLDNLISAVQQLQNNGKSLEKPTCD